ncbi:chromate transporter [Amycolatopsis sp. NPDC050768]|uniref:chromate transporter n=1 Tax=Amycolatopsis sp. NPDC050768 TaxID=3154839 RepID=UPI00340FC23A
MTDDTASQPSTLDRAPGLSTVLAEWSRIGCIGFGGPPTHITLLRALCVQRRKWLSEQEFEDAIAACNLLPGPASTQLAIFTAWQVRGDTGRHRPGDSSSSAS